MRENCRNKNCKYFKGVWTYRPIDGTMQLSHSHSVTTATMMSHWFNTPPLWWNHYYFFVIDSLFILVPYRLIYCPTYNIQYVCAVFLAGTMKVHQHLHFTIDYVASSFLTKQTMLVLSKYWCYVSTRSPTLLVCDTFTLSNPHKHIIRLGGWNLH